MKKFLLPILVCFTFVSSYSGILATTDPQKLPSTILSRCIQITYSKASIDEMVTALSSVATAEGVSIGKSELERIAQSADGSFRDAVKLLENVSLGKKNITSDDVDTALGKSVTTLVSTLLNALLKKNMTDILTVFETLKKEGIEHGTFQKKVLDTLHERLVLYAQKNDTKLSSIVKLLQTLAVPPQPTSPYPHLPFELACVEWCFPPGGENAKMEEHPQVVTPKVQVEAQKKEVKKNDRPVKEPEKQNEKNEQTRTIEIPKENQLSKTEEVTESALSTHPVAVIDFSLIETKWTAVLQKVRGKSVPVEGLLRSAQPLRVEGEILICGVGYQFHKEQLELDRNRHVVESVLESFLRSPVKLRFELGKKAKISAKLPDSNISGSVEDTALVKAAEEAFLQN